MFRLSHILVCYSNCKLWKNYHYEGGHSETIAGFLVASPKQKKNKQTKKNVKCFSYSAFMALKHSTFASFLASTTSEFEYLLKRVLKITK